MRGSTSDFYIDAPTRRVQLNQFPPDFDPVYIDIYASKPLAPEVLECQTCKLIRVCQPGQYARPDCAERQVSQHYRIEYRPHETSREVVKAAVVAALQDGERTIGELSDMVGVQPRTLRYALTELVDSRHIECIGLRVSAKVYAATGRPFSPSDTRTSNAERILRVLREHGELTARDITRFTGLHSDVVRSELADLVHEGRIAKEPLPFSKPHESRIAYRALASCALPVS